MKDVVWVLLVLAALAGVVSAVGAAMMRDPWQRMHYLSPPSTLSVALVTIALFIDDPDKDVGAKAAFVTAAIAVMNGVIAHATARAARVHDLGNWRPTRSEHVLIRGRGGEVTP